MTAICSVRAPGLAGHTGVPLSWRPGMTCIFDWVAPPGVIARLDPKSGLPDFGIKLSKSETSDFDAIQYPPAWLLDRPVKPGDDNTEAGQPNPKMH
jgi:hypothetical protein